MSLVNIAANNLSATVAFIALVVAAAFIIFFRKEIRGILAYHGSNIHQTGDQKEVPSAQPELNRRVTVLDVKPDSNEARLYAEVLSKILLESQSTSERKLELALIDAANHTLRYEFEVTYRNIYGSQLDALLALKKEGPQPLAKFHDRFLERFEAFKAEHPHLNIKTDFETWLSFLVHRPFPYVSIDGGMATITSRGQELLTYIASMSLSTTRLL